MRVKKKNVKARKFPWAPVNLTPELVERLKKAATARGMMMQALGIDIVTDGLDKLDAGKKVPEVRGRVWSGRAIRVVDDGIDAPNLITIPRERFRERMIAWCLWCRDEQGWEISNPECELDRILAEWEAAGD